VRRLLVIGSLVACAVPAWAGLAHVQAVTCDARSFVRLARIKAVDSVVPQAGTIPAAKGLSSDDVEGGRILALRKSANIEADAIQISALPGLKSDKAVSVLPRFLGIRAVDVQQVDPFLTWFDIWNEGALGELRAAAVEAAKGGDDVGFRKLTEQYWAGVAIATERRRILVEKPDNEGIGLRGSRRSGH
jgi:hypothetical protein